MLDNEFGLGSTLQIIRGEPWSGTVGLPQIQVDGTSAYVLRLDPKYCLSVCWDGSLQKPWILVRHGLH